jgi:hypothetical protein
MGATEKDHEFGTAVVSPVFPVGLPATVFSPSCSSLTLEGTLLFGHYAIFYRKVH